MQQELKRFNKSIEVSVSVDLIASKLMDMMDKSNPNAALLVNTIIGSSLSTGKIGFVYNALNGWVDEINVTVGKSYTISGNKLDMYRATTDEKECEKIVTVIDIDEYRDGNKVKVEYPYKRIEKNDAGFERVTSSTWVAHSSLTELPGATDEFAMQS